MKKYSTLDAYDHWNPSQGYEPQWVLASDHAAEVARLWDVILNCELIYENGGSGKSMAQYLRGVIDRRTTDASAAP